LRGASYFVASSFEIVGSRPLAPPSGERDRERGTLGTTLLPVNLLSKKKPPHPGPLLHKCVEEREIDDVFKK
jgi:hypothetical protein